MRYKLLIGMVVFGVTVAAGGCDDETTTPLQPATGTATGSGTATGGTGGSTATGGTGGSTATGTAIGGNGGSTGTGGAAGAGAADGGGGALPTGPGTITLSVSGRNGDDGKTLIASVLTPTGMTRLGGLCETISSGAASGVVKAPDGVGNCDLGSAVTFDAGDYAVSAGIYPSGSSTPELCASRSVTVGGDISVTLSNFTSCQ